MGRMTIPTGQGRGRGVPMGSGYYSGQFDMSPEAVRQRNRDERAAERAARDAARAAREALKTARPPAPDKNARTRDTKDPYIQIDRDRIRK